MSASLLTSPLWVDSQSKLINALTDLSKEPRIAVDTESNSLYAYKEQVCLIQFSSTHFDYLIDPFEIKDLSPLGNLFSNPDQEKIFHASEYDLICLKRDYGFNFANLFDTMIAARILGEPQIGLGSLLSTKFGLDLDKRYQRANWGIRPLSDEMKDYARLDTHYLFELRDMMERSLRETNQWDLAKEDFRLACNVQRPVLQDFSNECWKVAGSVRIDPHQAAVLQTLCGYRDRQAQKANLPHFKILSNKVLLEICLHLPKTIEDLTSIDGLTEKNIERHGKGLLCAIVEGENQKALHRAPKIKPDEQFIERYEKLKDWRRNQAKELKVESDVVLSKDMLEKISGHNPRSLAELAEVMTSTKVRFERYGTSIIKTLLE